MYANAVQVVECCFLPEATQIRFVHSEHVLQLCDALAIGVTRLSFDKGRLGIYFTEVSFAGLRDQWLHHRLQFLCGQGLQDH